MTQAQKAMIAFVIIPLVAVVITSIFSPGGPYPTGDMYPGSSIMLWLVGLLVILGLGFMIFRASRRVHH